MPPRRVDTTEAPRRSTRLRNNSTTRKYAQDHDVSEVSSDHTITAMTTESHKTPQKSKEYFFKSPLDIENEDDNRNLYTSDDNVHHKFVIDTPHKPYQQATLPPPTAHHIGRRIGGDDISDFYIPTAVDAPKRAISMLSPPKYDYEPPDAADNSSKKPRKSHKHSNIYLGTLNQHWLFRFFLPQSPQSSENIAENLTNANTKLLFSKSCLNNCTLFTKLTITSLSLLFALLLVYIIYLINSAPNSTENADNYRETIGITLILLNLALLSLYFPAHLFLPTPQQRKKNGRQSLSPLENASKSMISELSQPIVTPFRPKSHRKSRRESSSRRKTSKSRSPNSHKVSNTPSKERVEDIMHELYSLYNELSFTKTPQKHNGEDGEISSHSRRDHRSHKPRENDDGELNVRHTPIPQHIRVTQSSQQSHQDPHKTPDQSFHKLQSSFHKLKDRLKEEETHYSDSGHHSAVNTAIFQVINKKLDEMGEHFERMVITPRKGTPGAHRNNTKVPLTPRFNQVFDQSQFNITDNGGKTSDFRLPPPNTHNSIRIKDDDSENDIIEYNLDLIAQQYQTLLHTDDEYPKNGEFGEISSEITTTTTSPTSAETLHSSFDVILQSEQLNHNGVHDEKTLNLDQFSLHYHAYTDNDQNKAQNWCLSLYNQIIFLLSVPGSVIFAGVTFALILLFDCIYGSEGHFVDTCDKQNDNKNNTRQYDDKDDIDVNLTTNPIDDDMDIIMSEPPLKKNKFPEYQEQNNDNDEKKVKDNNITDILRSFIDESTDLEGTNACNTPELSFNVPKFEQIKEEQNDNSHTSLLLQYCKYLYVHITTILTFIALHHAVGMIFQYNDLEMIIHHLKTLSFMHFFHIFLLKPLIFPFNVLSTTVSDYSHSLSQLVCTVMLTIFLAHLIVYFGANALLNKVFSKKRKGMSDKNMIIYFIYLILIVTACGVFVTTGAFSSEYDGDDEFNIATQFSLCLLLNIPSIIMLCTWFYYVFSFVYHFFTTFIMKSSNNNLDKILPNKTFFAQTRQIYKIFNIILSITYLISAFVVFLQISTPTTTQFTTFITKYNFTIPNLSFLTTTTPKSLEHTIPPRFSSQNELFSFNFMFIQALSTLSTQYNSQQQQNVALLKVLAIILIIYMFVILCAQCLYNVFNNNEESDKDAQKLLKHPQSTHFLAPLITFLSRVMLSFYRFLVDTLCFDTLSFNFPIFTMISFILIISPFDYTKYYLLLCDSYLNTGNSMKSSTQSGVNVTVLSILLLALILTVTIVVNSVVNYILYHLYKQHEQIDRDRNPANQSTFGLNNVFVHNILSMLCQYSPHKQSSQITGIISILHQLQLITQYIQRVMITIFLFVVMAVYGTIINNNANAPIFVLKNFSYLSIGYIVVLTAQCMYNILANQQ